MNHKELIERLRYGSLCPVSGDGCEDKLKAADAIESLFAENERLKAELAKYRDAPVVAYLHFARKKPDLSEVNFHKEPSDYQKANGWVTSQLIVKPGE